MWEACAFPKGLRKELKQICAIERIKKHMDSVSPNAKDGRNPTRGFGLSISWPKSAPDRAVLGIGATMHWSELTPREPALCPQGSISHGAQATILVIPMGGDRRSPRARRSRPPQRMLRSGAPAAPRSCRPGGGLLRGPLALRCEAASQQTGERLEAISTIARRERGTSRSHARPSPEARPEAGLQR